MCNCSRLTPTRQKGITVYTPINYDVGACVNLRSRADERGIELGGPVFQGTLAGAVHYVKRLPTQHQSSASIFLDHGSGLQKTILDLPDVKLLCARSDFPPVLCC